MVPVCWEQFKYGLLVNSETVALYRDYGAAIEAMEHLYGQGFDLAIWNIETQETMYTANWGDGENYRTEHEEEAFQHALDEEILCNETYCPWWQEHRCSPSCPTCEGAWCEEAWQQYKDSLEEDSYEEVSKERKGT